MLSELTEVVNSASSEAERIQCAVTFLEDAAVSDERVLHLPDDLLATVLNLYADLTEGVDGETAVLGALLSAGRTAMEHHRVQEADLPRTYCIFWSVVLKGLLSSVEEVMSIVSCSHHVFGPPQLIDLVGDYLSLSLRAAKLVANCGEQQQQAAEKLLDAVSGVDANVRDALFRPIVCEKALFHLLLQKLQVYYSIVCSDDARMSAEVPLPSELVGGLLIAAHGVQETIYVEGSEAEEATSGALTADEAGLMLRGAGAQWVRVTLFFVTGVLDSISFGGLDESGNNVVLLPNLETAQKAFDAVFAVLAPQESEMGGKDPPPGADALLDVDAIASREVACTSTQEMKETPSYDLVEKAVTERLNTVAKRLCNFRSPNEFIIMLLKEALPPPHSPHTPCSSSCSGPFTCSRCLLKRSFPTMDLQTHSTLEGMSYSRVSTLIREMLQRLIPAVAHRFTSVAEHKEALLRLAQKCEGDRQVLQCEGRSYLGTLRLHQAAMKALIAFLKELIAAVHIEVSHYLQREHDGSKLCVTVEGSFIKLSKARQLWESVVSSVKVPPCFVELRIQAAVSLEIDEDFRYPGITVTLAARSILVCSSRVIDVSGAHGADGVAGTDGVKRGDRGSDGTSGAPGQDGGSISITAGAVIRGSLALRSNGGQGGCGGRGGNGCDGADGVSGVSAEKRYPKASRSNMCGSSTVFNYNYLIAIEPQPATAAPGRGGAAGRRGMNGFGGSAGTISVSPLTPNIRTQSYNGDNGRRGASGCAGLAGKGGNQSTAGIYRGCYASYFSFKWKDLENEDFHPTPSFSAKRATRDGNRAKWKGDDILVNYTYGSYPCIYTKNTAFNANRHILRNGRLIDRSTLNGETPIEEAGTVSSFAHSISSATIRERIGNCETSTSCVQRVDLSSISTSNSAAQCSVASVEGEALGVLMRCDLESITLCVEGADSVKEALERHQERVQTHVGVSINAPSEPGLLSADPPQTVTGQPGISLPFLPLSVLAAPWSSLIQDVNIAVAKHASGCAGCLLEASAALAVVLDALQRPSNGTGAIHRALMLWCSGMRDRVEMKLKSLAFASLKWEVTHSPSYVAQWALDVAGRRLSFYSCCSVLQSPPCAEEMSGEERSTKREKAECTLTCRLRDLPSICADVGAVPVCPLLITSGGLRWGSTILPSVGKLAFQLLQQPLLTRESTQYELYAAVCGEFCDRWRLDQQVSSTVWLYLSEEYSIQLYEWLRSVCASCQEEPEALHEIPVMVRGWLRARRSLPEGTNDSDGSGGSHCTIKVMHFWQTRLCETGGQEEGSSCWPLSERWDVLTRSICQLGVVAASVMELVEIFIGDILQRLHAQSTSSFDSVSWCSCSTRVKEMMPNRESSGYPYALALRLYFSFHAMYTDAGLLLTTIENKGNSATLTFSEERICRCSLPEEARQAIAADEEREGSTLVLIPAVPCERCRDDALKHTAGATDFPSALRETMAELCPTPSGDSPTVTTESACLLGSTISFAHLVTKCLPYVLASVEGCYGDLVNVILEHKHPSLLERLADYCDAAASRYTSFAGLYMNEYEVVSELKALEVSTVSKPFAAFASSSEDISASPTRLFLRAFPKRRHAVENLILSLPSAERPTVFQFLSLASKTFASAADLDVFAAGLPKADLDAIVRACIHCQLCYLLKESFGSKIADLDAMMKDVEQCCVYADLSLLAQLCQLLCAEFDQMRPSIPDSDRRLVVYPEIVRLLMTLLIGYAPDEGRGGQPAPSATQWLSRLMEDKYWATVATWWPSCTGARWNQLWQFGLRLDECRAGAFLSWMRRLTNEDVMKRLPVVLDVSEPVKSSLALFTSIADTEPSTWSALVGTWERDFLHLQKCSDDTICERGWDAIEQWVTEERQSVTLANVALAKRIWNSFSTAFKELEDLSALQRRLERFRQEWEKNTHSSKEQRVCESDVRQKERMLLQSEAKLTEVLITIFAAFFASRGGMVPRRVQVLAVLELIQGSRLANINTSEGKTYTCGVIFAFKAYCGYSVAFMSSNEALAEDAYRYHAKAFKMLFGCSFAAVDSPPADCPVKRDDRAFQYHSVYTTLHNLQSHWLIRSMNARSEVSAVVVVPEVVHLR